MGLNIHTLEMLLESLDLLEVPTPKGLTVCELGNLYVRPCVHRFMESEGMPLYKTAKELFTHMGFKDTSIDWNGKDGTLPLDLGKPVGAVGQFDVIMNGGTAEHVYDQYECWKNIHNLCKDGGLVVSIGPLAGNWLKHSPWRYSLEFFDCLCFKNNYDLLERKVVNFKKQKGFDCHYVSFRKKTGAFIRRDVFTRIWNSYHKKD